jgi:hypothetical protein
LEYFNDSSTNPIEGVTPPMPISEHNSILSILNLLESIIDEIEDAHNSIFTIKKF